MPQSERRLTPQEVLHKLLEEIKKEVTTTEWKETPNLQARSIQRLLAVPSAAGRDFLDYGHRLIREGLGWTQDRYRHLHNFSPEDIHRALRADPTGHHRRFKADQVYPHTGWLGDFLLHAQDSEAPLGWIFWGGVACISTAARRKFFHNHGPYSIWPHHYIMLVGPSGIGKNLAIAPALDILTRLNEVLESEYGYHPAQTLQILPETVTPERMLSMLSTEEISHENPVTGQIIRFHKPAQGIIINEEIVTLLGKNLHRADSFVHKLTAFYTKDTWENATISRGAEKMVDIAINLVGGSTVDWLRGAATEDVFGGGFMGRCIVSHRGEYLIHRAWPPTVDPVRAEELARRLIPIVQQDELWDMQPDKGARKFFQDWYDDNRSRLGEDDRMNGYIARKGSHVLKLGLILSLSEGQMTLTEKALRKAVEILDREENELPQVLSELTGTGDQSELTRIFSKIEHSGRISRAHLGRSFKHTKDKLDLYLNTLKDMGAIKVEMIRPPTGKGGHPTQWIVAAISMDKFRQTK